MNAAVLLRMLAVMGLHVACSAAKGAGLRVDVTDAGLYSLSLGTEVLLESLGNDGCGGGGRSGCGVNVDGQWCACGACLLPSPSTTTYGMDTLGYYTRTAVAWESKRFRVQMITAFRVYADSTTAARGNAVVFEQRFPLGVRNTSLNSSMEPLSAFPAWCTRSGILVSAP